MFEGLYISSLLDSAFTGCHTTTDRLHSSHVLESDACHFCGNEPETIQRITESYGSIDCGISKPNCPDFGLNFMHLGLVEISLYQVSNRLSIGNLNHIFVLIAFILFHKPNTFGQMAVYRSQIMFGGRQVAALLLMC